MDREASRGNRQRDKEKGGKRKERGGEEEVVVVGRGMSRLITSASRRWAAGQEEEECWRGCFETVGATGVSNCRADKPQPRPCWAGVTGVWWW